MILMVYVGVFLLAYGMYHLIAHLAYFPSEKAGRSISDFWRAMCLELAGYVMKRFSLTSTSYRKLKILLQLNQEKKDETVWLLEKCIGSLGVFCLCSPLLLVQPKVFLLCLGAGLFVVWYELLLYCVKSMGDKRILQRELPFFLLLCWKYTLEGRNESDYLAACQMVVTEDFLEEERCLLLKASSTGFADPIIKEVIFRTSNKETVDEMQVWYQKQRELYQGLWFRKQIRRYNHIWILIYAYSVISFLFYFVCNYYLLVSLGGFSI